MQLYTPVNEMFICAIFSAKYGWWNEQTKDDRSFVTALKHIVQANVMAMIEILKRRHDAIFIQSESTEYFHAENPAAIKPAMRDEKRAAQTANAPPSRNREPRLRAPWSSPAPTSRSGSGNSMSSSGGRSRVVSRA